MSSNAVRLSNNNEVESRPQLTVIATKPLTMEDYKAQADEAIVYYHSIHSGGDGKFPTKNELYRLNRLADAIIKDNGGIPGDTPTVPYTKNISPGKAAIDYARELTAGLTRKEAARVLSDAEPDGKRVKRCKYCNCLFRDNSLRNTRRTCDDECKVLSDTLTRSIKSRDSRPATPRDYGYPEGYRFWEEYPSWDDDKVRDNYLKRNEKPSEPLWMDKASAKREIWGNSNRRTPIRVPGVEDKRAGREFNMYTRREMRS